ncbi:hypothetical protein PHISCL_00953 [Aspergillus sclerotialis]|uniref:Uncharacterized protein n=1 Tax=Aspergillus sclerotialis TaxID=2070753 RepID=A0A3A2ZUA5_9EURO|nr:hypothetical protein PHISCL_00953 [Aspergillus sclerotialis]
MLLRFVFTTALFFGGCAANVLAVESSPSSAIENHEIHLPCLHSGSIHQNTDQSAFLTVNFAVTNNTLFANNNPIFPPSIPMRLNARRYRELDKSDADIPLTFSLDVKPFLSHSGNTFLLKITLLDLLGEPAVTDTVAIDLLQDSNGTLDISRIRLDPTHGSNRSWQLKYWRTRVNECLIAMKNSAMSSFTRPSERPPCSHHHHHTHPSPYMTTEPANNNPSTSNSKSGTSAFSSVSIYKSHHRFHHGPHGHHRAYYRYLRQAILPGVLGMTAALIACGVGFVVGKVSISLYLHFKDNKERAKKRVKRRDVEYGDADEKQRLLIVSRGTM